MINQTTFVDVNNNPTTAVTNDLKSIIYSESDSRFVAVGNNGVCHLLKWDQLLTDSSRVDRAPLGSQENLNDIIHAESKYVSLLETMAQLNMQQLLLDRGLFPH